MRTVTTMTLFNVLEANMINKNLISQLPMTRHGCAFNMYFENFAIKAKVSICVKILVKYHLGLLDVEKNINNFDNSCAWFALAAFTKGK